VQFRRADGEDIPLLINMRLAYLSEDYGGLTEEQTCAIRSQLSGYLKKHLNEDLLVFICEDGNAIVSTVFLHIIERPANPGFITGLTGTILNVYTLPQYRKKGIAGSLMRMAIEEAKCRNLSYLDLKATQAGYPLYRKLGFAPDDTKCTSMIYYIGDDNQ